MAKTREGQEGLARTREGQVALARTRKGQEGLARTRIQVVVSRALGLRGITRTRT